MKSIFKFLAIVLAIVLLSAFLAPLLYQYLPYKFERIFNRLIMIFTLAAILAFVRLTPQTFSKYGLTWRQDSRSLLGIGFATGFLTLVLLAALKLSVGMALWELQDLSALQWILKFVVALATALLVGVVEEFFFRGFIFSFFKNEMKSPLILAVLATSLFYSLIHFVGENKPFVDSNPNFIDGLKLAFAPFQSLLAWKSFWRDALGLFLFGIILNTLVLQTGSLYLAIGLHAGCVFFIKADGLFLGSVDKYPFLWGTDKMYDSLIGWLFLALMGGFLWKKFQRRSLACAAAFFLILAGTPGAKAAVPEKLSAKEKQTYSFSTHLPQAEAQLFNSQKEPEVAGVWKENHFVFPGFETEGDIKDRLVNLDGRPQNVIAVRLVSGRVHQLKFRSVPPGSRLVLYNRLAEAAPSKNPIYTYLRILVGQHELQRIQISTKNPWQKQEFDLGIVSFLDREVTVTFELTPEQVKGLTFAFIAELHK